MYNVKMVYVTFKCFSIKIRAHLISNLKFHLYNVLLWDNTNQGLRIQSLAYNPRSAQHQPNQESSGSLLPRVEDEGVPNSRAFPKVSDSGIPDLPDTPCPCRSAGKLALFKNSF